MLGTTIERRGAERRLEPLAGLALLRQVREHGTARVVVKDDGTRLEPDLQPQLVAVLRQLRALVAAADQPIGPSKSDSIRAMRDVLANLPPELLT
jgi:hypothetical protein